MSYAARVSPASGTRLERFSEPRFLSFLAAQFFVALNDNAFKVAVLFIALGSVTDESQRLVYSSLITAIFALPWLLFSARAGHVADRFRKDRVLLATKLPEVLFMALSVAGFATGSVSLLLLVFFLISTQSVFFSPAKYGLLPEIFGEEDLAPANGLLGMTTNIAILLGTALGGALAAARGELGNIGWVFVSVAAGSTVCAFYLPRVPAGARDAPRPAGPVRQCLADLRVVRARPALASTVLGVMFFTFLGALLLTLVPVYCSDVLGLDTEQSSIVLTALVIGVALGSLGAGWLSKGRVEVGLVPLGALVMAAFSFDASFLPASGPGALRLSGLSLPLPGRGPVQVGAGVPLRSLVDFAMLGVGAGLFNVPLLASLQRLSPENATGRVIAFSNVAGNLMIVAAAALPLTLALVASGIGGQGGTIRALMILMHGLTVLGALYILFRIPDYTARFFVYLLVQVLYRLRIHDTHRLPRGGALLVANHVSWVDALVVTAASGRMVRFMMYRPIYETRGLHWLFQRLHVIPVAGGDDRERTREALELAREEIRSGHVVCIFAEGAITRSGQLLEFRRGLERIMEGLDAPVVPVYLQGLWGSIFSFKGGRLLLKWPRRFRARIHVLFGHPLPSTSSAFAVRQAVQGLSVDALALERDRARTLGCELLRAARGTWSRPHLVDARRGTLSFGAVLEWALRLRGREIDPLPVDERTIAVLARPGTEALLANWAVLLAGRVPVNLPDGAPEAARSALRAAGVRRVLASPALWEELAGQAPGAEGIHCVDLGAAVAAAEQGPRLGLGARLALRALPFALVRRLFTPGDPRDDESAAAVLFTRGHRGAPRAVVLSHRNLCANLVGLREVLDLGPEARVLAPAAFWHSIGFVCGLALPAFVGAQVAHAADWRNVEALARVARELRPTLLFAPPSRLELYIERLEPEVFSALEQIITGGEPLSPELRDRSAERLRVEPLEAYGCAECSPLISLNAPPSPFVPSSQPRAREGTLGQPLPGIAVGIFDPSSGQALGADQPGHVRVRGPNVARGVLEDGEEHSLCDPEGWYDTGDLGILDRAGFLRVLGRDEPSTRDKAPIDPA